MINTFQESRARKGTDRSSRVCAYNPARPIPAGTTSANDLYSSPMPIATPARIGKTRREAVVAFGQ